MILGRPLAVSALAFLVFAGLLICQQPEPVPEDWFLQLIAQSSSDARIAQREFDHKWNDVFAGGPAVKTLYLELKSGAANVKSFERVDKAIAVLQADPGWLRKEKRK